VLAENRVAILGGTFNPVHNGHVAMAEAAIAELNLSKVVFLPNGNPPHKGGTQIADACKRYDMVSIAVRLNSRFEVSDYEIKQTKPSYTIETLPFLKSMYGDDISYIIGADFLYSLHKWKRYRELICQCKFIVADRSCDAGSDLSGACSELISHGADITCIKMPRVDVSSTQIRQMAARGLDFRNLVPPGVYEYITNNNLYQPCMEDENDY